MVAPTIGRMQRESFHELGIPRILEERHDMVLRLDGIIRARQQGGALKRLTARQGGVYQLIGGLDDPIATPETTMARDQMNMRSQMCKLMNFSMDGSRGSRINMDEDWRR